MPILNFYLYYENVAHWKVFLLWLWNLGIMQWIESECKGWSESYFWICYNLVFKQFLKLQLGDKLCFAAGANVMTQKCHVIYPKWFMGFQVHLPSHIPRETVYIAKGKYLWNLFSNKLKENKGRILFLLNYRDLLCEFPCDLPHAPRPMGSDRLTRVCIAWHG